MIEHKHTSILIKHAKNVKNTLHNKEINFY
jgi:hypothetical protein